MVRGVRRTLAIAMAALALSAEARADAIFNVSLNTASLAVAPGSDSGPFGLFFQLTDGSGLADGNNTATLSAFDFGGGALLPDTSIVEGGVTGSPATVLALTDSSFFSFFFQGFVPGNTLSFVLSLTTNSNGAGLPPDAFAFSLLDAFGAPIPTVDPTFADTLLTINLDSLAPVVATYGTDASRTDLRLDPASAKPVPEPATFLLIGMGFGVACLVRRRRSE